jgi:hypothetical protein
MADMAQRQEFEPGEPTRITLSIKPVVDLHFHVRSLLHAGGKIPPEAAEVVEKARAFERAVDGPLGWGFIEPLLVRCETARDLEQWAGQLPERFRLRSGPLIRPREASTAYVRALPTMESVFMKEIWPDHQRAIEKASESLNRYLEEHGAAAVAFIVKHLNMEIDQRPAQVYLVADAPPPGAYTSASRGIGVTSFVGVSGFPDSALAEVVLHEVIHALDLRTRGKPTALNRLREMLRHADLPSNDPLMRDIPHTIIFVEAAETVQRLVNPAHEPYGHDHSFFDKAPEAAKRVLPRWKSYLDGSITLDEALSAIVEGLGSKAESRTRRPPEAKGAGNGTGGRPPAGRSVPKAGTVLAGPAGRAQAKP